MLTLMAVSMASAKQLYVIGSGVFGGWNPGSPVPMTLADDGVTNTMDITLTGTEWWTVCDGADGDWDVFNSTYRYGVQSGDVEVTMGEYPLQKCNGTLKLGAGEYTITVNSETMVMTIAGQKEDLVINTISIMGELTGGWEEDKDFDLTQTGDGIWTGTVTGFEAQGGKTYLWKVRANHHWGDFDIPTEGNNEITFESDGIYDLVFTVDVNEQTASIGFEKKEDVVIEKDYFVAGQEALMGVEWNPSAPENQMTENEDGTYTLSFKATLTAGENYQFKVVTNGDWEQPSFGADTESGNFEFTVDEDGDYDITITFKPATEEITITLEKDTTGIGTIQSSKLNAQSNIYNLRGQRVNASTRGILIVNGKKVVVK